MQTHSHTLREWRRQSSTGILPLSRSFSYTGHVGIQRSLTHMQRYKRKKLTMALQILTMNHRQQHVTGYIRSIFSEVCVCFVRVHLCVFLYMHECVCVPACGDQRTIWTIVSPQPPLFFWPGIN